MGDPFRRIFLDTLEFLLRKDPSHDTQLELLRLVSPGLDEGALGNHAETKKLFRTLLTRVHPDKHPQDTKRATLLCQDVKVYWEKCSVVSPEPKKKRRKTSHSPTSRDFPLEFTVASKWPHMDLTMKYAQTITVREQACLVAFQCINARGAIAHGRRIQNSYGSDYAIDKAIHSTSVEDVFTKYFDGWKEISGVDDIKEEIMHRGPVVSTSFSPSQSFYDKNPSIMDQNDCLIVGWKQMRAGEVWIVKPLSKKKGADLVNISVGQFGIDDCCLAPTSSLEGITWENGPYFDIDMSSTAEEWRTTWDGLRYPISNFHTLEPLFKSLGTTVFNCPGLIDPKKHEVCIRDSKKKAHSRRGTLRSIQWTEKKWTVVFDF